MTRKDLWREIPPGGNVPEEINIVVEIPKGSQNKYEYNKDYGVFELDRVLYSPIYYPGDYGIIPQTYAEDGDPLDGLVLVTNPTYPGVLIRAKPIGVLEMVDDGEKDDKILAVPVTDPRYSHYNDISELPNHLLKEIAHFFQVYKELQGKKVEVLGWKGAGEAKQVVQKCIELYKEKFGNN